MTDLPLDVSPDLPAPFRIARGLPGLMKRLVLRAGREVAVTVAAVGRAFEMAHVDPFGGPGRETQDRRRD